MRIWISGGGTGGHVYPGLAVVEALQAGSPPAPGPASEPDAICWIGSQGGVERELVERAGLPFQAIAAGGLHGLAPWTAARNLVRLARGAVQVWKLSSDWKPQVLLVTGGFVSAPVALVCWLRRVPILVYLPDIEPGLAVRFVSRFAARIGVTAEASRSFLPAHKVVVTGYPVRQELVRARAARDQGQSHFGLEPSLKTVLVFGGSKGARSLNRALGQVLDQVLARWQVVHISGTFDSGAAQLRREMLSQELKTRYKLFAYLHGEEMGMALAAADVVVSRAGASVLGELPLMGLPAILVPYPFAWRYQKVNADYLVEQGAAVLLEDRELVEGLLPALTSLLGDEARWSAMRERASGLARPDAASALAMQLRALVAESSRKTKPV